MRVILVASLVLLVAGCTSGGDEPATRSTTPGEPVVSVSPPFDRSTLPPLVLAAQLPPDGLRPIGGPATFAVDEAKTYNTAMWCGQDVTADLKGGGHDSHLREWSWDFNVVLSVVHGYGNSTGVEALESVKKNAESCATFTATNGDQYRMGGPIELPPPPKVDASYAICAKLVRGGKTYSYCYAYLARGRLLAAVQVAARTLNGEPAFLRRVAPLIAQALVAPAQ